MNSVFIHLFMKGPEFIREHTETKIIVKTNELSKHSQGIVLKKVTKNIPNLNISWEHDYIGIKNGKIWHSLNSAKSTKVSKTKPGKRGISQRSNQKARGTSERTVQGEVVTLQNMETFKPQILFSALKS